MFQYTQKSFLWNLFIYDLNNKWGTSQLKSSFKITFQHLCDKCFQNILHHLYSKLERWIFLGLQWKHQHNPSNGFTCQVDTYPVLSSFSQINSCQSDCKWKSYPLAIPTLLSCTPRGRCRRRLICIINTHGYTSYWDSGPWCSVSLSYSISSKIWVTNDFRNQITRVAELNLLIWFPVHNHYNYKFPTPLPSIRTACIGA